MSDYPWYVFSCGCTMSRDDFDLFRKKLWKSGKSYCPQHPDSPLDHKVFRCTCGTEFDAAPRSRGMAQLYCRPCQKARDRDAVDRYQLRQKESTPNIHREVVIPIPRPDPPILFNDPEIHPCRRCEIGKSGACKATNTTCHYCQHRIDWAEAQERKWG